MLLVHLNKSPCFKKKFIFSFFFLSFFFIFQSCSSNTGDPTSDETVGTVIDRPGTPSSVEIEFFPDFSINLPQDTLLQVYEENKGDETNQTGAEEKEGEGPPRGSQDLLARYWNNTFLEGDLFVILSRLEELEVLGEKINSTGLMEPGSDSQIINLEEYLLYGTSSPWEVEVMLDNSDPDYIRVYGKNETTSFYEWSYLFLLNEDGEVARGILAFVNPAWFEVSDGEREKGVRFLEMALDFTDHAKNQIVLRTERWHPNAKKFVASEFHQQCDMPNKECIGEHLEEKRGELNTRSHFRFTYNDTTRMVCFGAVDPASTATVKTFYFEGPRKEDNSEVKTDACSVPDPVWVFGGHVFTLDDLPDSSGSTAQEFFVDGESKTGWDQLTPERIDSLLYTP